jgi:GNAT superfamily N-acetyltransferase
MGLTIDGTVTLPMRIALATPENIDTVLSLVDEASAWLRTKDTDQWMKPWPDRDARDARVMRGLVGEKTWIVWDGDVAAATVTLTPRLNPKVWSRPGCTCNLGERAVYAHRLVTARHYAGWGLGAQLIDWAGLRARSDYGAKWIRIDVWTTNTALHRYYLSSGFEPCGFCDDPDYPSGRLFQKRTARIDAADTPLFHQPSPAHAHSRTSVRELVPALPECRVNPSPGYGSLTFAILRWPRLTSNGPDHGHMRHRLEPANAARRRLPAAAPIRANQSYRIIEEER